MHKAFLIADWSLNLSNGKKTKIQAEKSQTEITKGKEPVEVRKKISVCLYLFCDYIICALVCALLKKKKNEIHGCIMTKIN